uniref:MULE transposase domain-containing protein n=1 Tax=Lactuca sativa TaxID=4236 RepID=A0A9R1WG00_LACSA|nr:hypothetical protein LSAT_V11C200074130 [Lactuca sativa]
MDNKEDIDSYTWLMKYFLKAFGKQPMLVLSDEDSVMKACQSQEAPNLGWRLWNLPSHHGLDLGRVDQNPVLVDKVSEKLHLAQPKLTLGELGIQALPPQGLQNLS